MKIREYITNEDWSTFVKEHPKGNIFQTPEMYEVYLRTKNFEPVLITVIDENEVLGILLTVIQKEYSGILGKITSRSIILGGPLVKDNNADILDFLLKAYNKKIKRKVVFSQFRNLWDWKDLRLVFEKNQYSYDAHLDILIDLEQDEESLWKNINGKARNKIRKANKAAITFKTIDIDENIVDISYQILENVYKNAKIPLADKSLFENSYNVLSKSNMIKFFCAVKDDQIIGIRIGLIYKDMIYDWYAGSLYEYYKFNPNDFLPYNILVWGHKEGFKVFDFGGAGKPNIPYGVRDHKMKFGGELVEFGRFDNIHKPILMSIAKVGLKLYKMVK